jgi:hypothetical protein
MSCMLREPERKRKGLRKSTAADAPSDAFPEDGSVQQTSNIPGPLPKKEN